MENFTCVYSSTPVPSNSFANTNVGFIFLIYHKGTYSEPYAIKA